ncbi:hypothetical protein [Streptomyces niveus]|uniref:hypothetical protein n=1 Tax=Streptomyces niveus TaxID=193462 RepID=UPI0036397C34
MRTPLVPLAGGPPRLLRTHAAGASRALTVRSLSDIPRAFTAATGLESLHGLNQQALHARLPGSDGSSQGAGS